MSEARSASWRHELPLPRAASVELCEPPLRQVEALSSLMSIFEGRPGIDEPVGDEFATLVRGTASRVH